VLNFLIIAIRLCFKRPGSFAYDFYTLDGRITSDGEVASCKCEGNESLENLRLVRSALW
jgi:hypothetical protein